MARVMPAMPPPMMATWKFWALAIVVVCLFVLGIGIEVYGLVYV